MINLVNILYYTVILNTNITFIYNIFEILIFLCENGFSFIINRCFSFLTYFVSIKVIISVFRLIFRPRKIVKNNRVRVIKCEIIHVPMIAYLVKQSFLNSVRLCPMTIKEIFYFF